MSVFVLDAPLASPRVLDAPEGAVAASMLPEGAIVYARGEAWLARHGEMLALPDATALNEHLHVPYGRAESAVEAWLRETDPVRRFEVVVGLAARRRAVRASDAVGVLLALLRMVLSVVPENRRGDVMHAESVVASSLGHAVDGASLLMAHDALDAPRSVEGLGYAAQRVCEGVQSMVMAARAARCGAEAMHPDDWTTLRRRGVDAIVSFVDGWAVAESDESVTRYGGAALYAQASAALRERMSAVIAERVNAHDVAAVLLGLPRYPALAPLDLGAPSRGAA